MDSTLCHCGKPLHYNDKSLQVMVEELVSGLGENVNVVAGGRTFAVQRHFIALHGIQGANLATLGFKEVTQPKPQPKRRHR